MTPLSPGIDAEYIGEKIISKISSAPVHVPPPAAVVLDEEPEREPEPEPEPGFDVELDEPASPVPLDDEHAPTAMAREPRPTASDPNAVAYTFMDILIIVTPPYAIYPLICTTNGLESRRTNIR